MSQYIDVENQDGVQTIRINRPDKKNAMTGGMYTGLADAIRSAQSDKQIRVTVVTGVKDSFTAGNDISDFVSQSETPVKTSPEKSKSRGLAPVPDLLDALDSADKPLLAAVNGLAIGIGTTMLFHFDLVYASDYARFAMPFINLGVVPEAGSSLLAPLAMGRQKACELFLFGEQFNTSTAIECGFVNQAFSVDELMPEVKQKALKLAAKAPSAIRRTKNLMRRFGPDLGEVMKAEMEIFAEQLRTAESKEAMQAFSERREADFSKFH
ncbi:MAG: enoyl-CoA hydratase [Pseudomonadales bacterium]|nr:enoyl-CoA hydratase [Pseudomonadales bacterium]